MSSFEAVSRPAYRAVVIAILCYFALLIVGSVADRPALVLAAQVLFGVVAIGVGALLATRSATVSPLVATAAGALVLGGLVQFLRLATGDPRLDPLGSALVLLGVGAYLAAIRTAD